APRTGILAGGVGQLVPVADPGAVDADDAIARLQPRSLGRTIGHELADYRWQAALQRHHAGLLHDGLVAGMRWQLVELQHARGGRAGWRADLQRRRVARLCRVGQRKAQIGPVGDFFTVDAEDPIAALDAGLCREVRDVADERLEIRFADHQHRPERGDGEDQVETGAGQHDQDALPDRLAGELAWAICGIDIALAGVQHLHVTAQRNPRHAILGTVLAIPRLDRLAETDRETQHLHAAAARDPEVAEFVEGHQDAQGDDHPPYRAQDVQKIAHAMRTGNSALPMIRHPT